jgi:hypothetical protein
LTLMATARPYPLAKLRDRPTEESETPVQSGSGKAKAVSTPLPLPPPIPRERPSVPPTSRRPPSSPSVPSTTAARTTSGSTTKRPCGALPRRTPSMPRSAPGCGTVPSAGGTKLTTHASSVSFETTITLGGDDRWSYAETTMHRMQEFPELPVHTDYDTMYTVGWRRPPRREASEWGCGHVEQPVCPCRGPDRH